MGPAHLFIFCIIAAVHQAIEMCRWMWRGRKGEEKGSFREPDWRVRVCTKHLRVTATAKLVDFNMSRRETPDRSNLGEKHHCEQVLNAQEPPQVSSRNGTGGWQPAGKSHCSVKNGRTVMKEVQMKRM